jgi:hypothetical protein
MLPENRDCMRPAISPHEPISLNPDGDAQPRRARGRAKQRGHLLQSTNSGHSETSQPGWLTASHAGPAGDARRLSRLSGALPPLPASQSLQAYCTMDDHQSPRDVQAHVLTAHRKNSSTSIGPLDVRNNCKLSWRWRCAHQHISYTLHVVGIPARKLISKSLHATSGLLLPLEYLCACTCISTRGYST